MYSGEYYEAEGSNRSIIGTGIVIAGWIAVASVIYVQWMKVKEMIG